MIIQYDCRRDETGWTAFDRWTGHVVILAGAEQTGLAWSEANDLVERLNRRRLDGDRSILQ
jgi:hypothetical protein